MTDIKHTTVTIPAILKFLGVVGSIIATILYGYVNIMIKLTQVEEAIKDKNAIHARFEKDIQLLKENDIQMFDLIENHVMVDDTKVREKILKLKEETQIENKKEQTK